MLSLIMILGDFHSSSTSMRSILLETTAKLPNQLQCLLVVQVGLLASSWVT